LTLIAIDIANILDDVWMWNMPTSATCKILLDL